jgi:hypothetical protein
LTGDLANLVLPSVNGMPGCNIRLCIRLETAAEAGVK